MAGGATFANRTTLDGYKARHFFTRLSTQTEWPGCMGPPNALGPPAGPAVSQAKNAWKVSSFCMGPLKNALRAAGSKVIFSMK